MYKKLNLTWKKIFLSLLVIFSLFFFIQPVHAQIGRQWTFMVYMSADAVSMDSALLDLQKMIDVNVGSTDDVAIAVLLDNSADASNSYYGIVEVGDTDSSAWCAYNIQSKLDVGDTQTLVNFIYDVANGDPNYPAENYAIIFWNATSLYGAEGTLSIKGIREALESLQAQNGSSVNINLIGFDGDFMGMLEVAYEIKDYADVMVVSEKDISLGTWPYTDILEALVADTQMNAEGLGDTIVQNYGISDEEDNTLSAVKFNKYSMQDLVGTWNMHSVSAGGWAEGWSYGTVDIDGDGNMTWTDFLDSHEGTVEYDVPDKVYISPDGVVTVDDVDLSFHGTMSEDKSLVVATLTGSGEGDSYHLIVLQKSGGTFVTSDLAGSWDMHSLRMGGYSCDSGWEHGIIDIDNSGDMTWQYYQDTDADETDTPTEGTLSITSDGVVTLSDEPLFHGVMSQDKSLFVGVNTGGDGDPCYDYQLIILQKRGDTEFSSEDLEGEWNIHSLWTNGGMSCDYDGGWWYGVMDVDSNGDISWQSFYGGEIDRPDTIAVSLDGSVTIENESFHGVMSQDKNTIVGVYGGYMECEDYQIIILQRVSSGANTIQTLANAVSYFAQAVMDENEAGRDANWDIIFLAQQRAGWYLPSSNRDLRSFMQGVSEYEYSSSGYDRNDTIVLAAQNVITAFDDCIIRNYSSDTEKDGGLSIYFPLWCYENGNINGSYNGDNLSFLYDDVVEILYKGIYYDGTPYTQFWDGFLDKYIGTEDPSVELVPGHSGIYTYSRTIPGGTTASSYVMISSPVIPDNPDAADPLAILRDDLGDYDNNIWRLFRWNSMLEPASYEEYPFPKTALDEEPSFEDLFLGSDYVIPGKGYWLISRDTKNIDVTGQLCSTFAPYPVFLKPGWNQIGTPFNFGIDFDTIWVFGVEGGEFGGEGGYFEISDLDYTFDAALENSLIYSTLWKYVNGSYSEISGTAVMNPGEGYWIYNKKDSNWLVFLVVNPIRSTLPMESIVSLERTLTAFGKLTEETPPPPPGGMEPEPDEEGSGGGGSGCFIATVCFGSPMSGEVKVLRNFRDKYLLTNPIGQLFVSTYYKYSPRVADFIAKHNFLKFLVRSTLYPVVKGCGVLDETPYCSE